jgi:hypothetical protein
MKKYLLLFLLTTSLSSRAQGNLNSGLLARFPFDGNLVDVTGNIGNVISTGASYGADVRNQANAALRLTGDGEVMIVPTGLLDFSTTGSFSFSVAFRTLSSGTQTFFSNQGTYSVVEDNSSRGWSLGFSSTQVGKLYLNLVRDYSANGGLGLATQASFNDGLWHTAAVTIDRSSRQIRLYVDGTAQALNLVSPRPNYGTVSGSTFTLDATASMFVDLSPGYTRDLTKFITPNNRLGLGYNGWLDEARFYNRVLTTDDVRLLSSQVLATLSAHASAQQLQLAPNPASPTGAIAVRLTQPVPASQLHVLDVLGRAVPARITARLPGSTEYELAGLPTGTYFLHVRLPESTAVRRFQVN